MDWEFTPKRVPHAEISEEWSTVKDGIPKKFKFPMRFNHHDIFIFFIILFKGSRPILPEYTIFVEKIISCTKGVIMLALL